MCVLDVNRPVFIKTYESLKHLFHNDSCGRVRKSHAPVPSPSTIRVLVPFLRVSVSEFTAV